MRLEFGIRLKIEDEDILPAETFAARIDELGGAKKRFDSDIVIIVFLVFALFLLFFLFRVLLGFIFLDVFDGLLRLLVFLILFLFAQRLAIFLGQRRDFVAIEIEESVFVRLVLGDFAGLVVFGFFLIARTGVVLLDFVDRFLIVVDFLKERFEVGQLDLRFFGEVKNAFADGGVNGRLRHSYLIDVRTAMQFDLVRKFQRAGGAIVIVINLLLDPADRRGFFYDQMRLRIEKHIALQSGRRGHFDLQRVFPPNLRVANERDAKFAFLRVDEMRIVILPRRFELRAVDSDERGDVAIRRAMPRRLAVVRLDDVLVANHEFRVIAVLQFLLDGEIVVFTVVV